MANPAGESNAAVLRLDFGRRLMLEFRGSPPGRSHRREALNCFAVDQKPKERCVLDNKPRISGARRADVTAWVHGSPHVEDLALPKYLKSCNFTLAKAVIRWMSVQEKHAMTATEREALMTGRVWPISL